MLEHIPASLLFFAAASLAISCSFGSSVNRKGKWVTAIGLVAALCAIKMGYDIRSLPRSHYQTLEIGRHSTTLDIRRSFKRLSKVYHPDKHGPFGDSYFQTVKDSYDVLMDEGMRDIYNRFGAVDLQFDPRKDEIKLIADIAVVYLTWAVLAYLMTIPGGARASRTWLMILAVTMLAVEAAFKLTETALPEWMPESLTEHEVVWFMHACFPGAVAALRVLSESLYVDADQTSLAVLKQVYMQQKGMSEQIGQLQQLLEAQREFADAPSQDAAAQQEQRRCVIQDKLATLRDDVDRAAQVATAQVDALRKCSSNPGSSYYWIVFVVLYGSVYFLQ